MNKTLIEQQHKKCVGDLALLAALMPEDSEAQNHVIEAVGEVCKAIRLLKIGQEATDGK